MGIGHQIFYRYVPTTLNNFFKIEIYKSIFVYQSQDIPIIPWKMVADLGTFDGFMLEFTMFIN